VCVCVLVRELVLVCVSVIMCECECEWVAGGSAAWCVLRVTSAHCCYLCVCVCV